jgi:hypothetical protein
VKKLLIRLTLAVLIIAFLTPVAFSEMRVFEPFDYPVGDLEGNTGAFGLTWGWEDWWGSTPACEVAEGSLIHPDYPTMEIIGNHAIVIDGGTGNGYDPFYDDGTSIWLSFLYQYVPGSEWGTIGIFFYDAPIDQGGTGTDFAATVVFLWGGYPGLSTYYTGGEAQGADVDDPLAVQWVVIKAETSGSPDTTEMIYLWVDPSADFEPDTATADVAMEYNALEGTITDQLHIMGGGDPIAYRIDNVKFGTDFFDVSPAPPCEMARYPAPADNEIDVDSNTTILSWQPPSCLEPESVSYDVYLGTLPGDDPNYVNQSPVAEEITETSYDASDDVTFLTTYYWRVDVHPIPGDPNIYQGDVWTFTTASRAPLIKIQPEDATVAAGAEAAFTVVVLNEPTYQWYYSETPDGAGAPITGATSATYIKSNVQETDEGYYYCVATNDDGQATSVHARLLTERLMAHWMFEGNLQDQVDPANNGTSIQPVSYTPGIDGQAVVIEPNEFVMIANEIGRLKSITVSAWINQNTLEGDQVILTATEGSDEGFVHLAGNEGVLTGEVVDSASLSSGDLMFGQWNHCVMTYNVDSGRMKLYLNGELTISGPIDASIAPLLPPLSIGAKNIDEGYYLDGAIDDVRIYNYPLSSLAVAKLYNTLSGDTACVYDPPDYQFTFDLNGDCVVDILDIEILAMNWANCNIVPDCQFSLPQ